jgi:hypothetical protein
MSDDAIVPAVGLGGFRIGAQIGEYREALFDRFQSHGLTLPLGDWGEYWPLWGVALSIPPITVHVDIRDGSVYRVEAGRGFDGQYHGVQIGMTWGEARERLPKIDYSESNQSLEVEGVSGLYFGLSDDDPVGPEEYLLQLEIESIGVFDPGKGTTLTF